MPGKGPAQHRLLVAHGPFSVLGPVNAQIAARNAIRRSARAAAAVVSDVIAGREPGDVTSEEKSLEYYLEDLTEDDSIEEDTSDDEVSGIKVTRTPVAYNHEPQDDSEEEEEEDEDEDEEEEEEEDDDDDDDNTQPTYYAPPVIPASAAVPAPTTAVINRNTQNIIPCMYCNREFSSLKARRQHERDRHIGTICRWPGCGTVTATEDQLIQHFHDHQRDAVAQGWNRQMCPWPNCGKEFSRGHTVQRCFKRHNRE